MSDDRVTRATKPQPFRDDPLSATAPMPMLRCSAFHRPAAVAPPPTSSSPVPRGPIMVAADWNTTSSTSSPSSLK